MNLLFWKHKTNGHVVGDEDLKKLPLAHQAHFEVTKQQPTHQVIPRNTVVHNRSTTFIDEDNSDFLLSALVGYETGSTLDGALVGGDLAGAALGDMLSQDDDQQQPVQQDEPVQMGGGDFGGAGSSGDWGSNQQDNDVQQQDNNQSDDSSNQSDNDYSSSSDSDSNDYSSSDDNN